MRWPDGRLEEHCWPQGVQTVEAVLQRGLVAPYCHRAMLAQALRELQALAERLDAVLVPVAGTLLGALYRGGVLPWTHDFEVLGLA